MSIKKKDKNKAFTKTFSLFQIPTTSPQTTTAQCKQLKGEPVIHNTSNRQLTLHSASSTCVKTKQIVVTTNNVISAAKRGVP